jgi:4-hydroxy-3-methylbut-2-enyl diphosphate reductase
VINTICRPVRNRQLSAVELAGEVDVMVIVGSRSSANTRELKHLCATYNERTIHVENASELDMAMFEGVQEVGVASGLSTPPHLVEEVVAHLYQASGSPDPAEAVRN